MMRLINVGLIALVIATATWTYSVKHEAQQRLVEIRALERAIDLEEETIELLRADWAHLSHPQRLQALAEAYAEDLGLQPADADQFVRPDDLPGPPLFDPGDAVGDIIVGLPTDQMTTGSIDGQGQ